MIFDRDALFLSIRPAALIWFFSQMRGAHNCSHSRRRSLENGRAQLRASWGDPVRLQLDARRRTKGGRLKPAVQGSPV
jgi:hypothetical protein